jgi:hypothetical protein
MRDGRNGSGTSAYSIGIVLIILGFFIFQLDRRIGFLTLLAGLLTLLLRPGTRRI